MKATLLALMFLSLNVFAGREIMFIQAYELSGGNSSHPANGDLGVTVSILNVSNIDQTVSWSGGIVANRLYNGGTFTPNPVCGLHTEPVPSHTKATKISSFKYKLEPNGFVTIWCSASAANPSNAPAGGEGVVKMTISIDEDRGAVMASGGMYSYDANSSNWGASGGGPFQINGGRAF